MKKLLLIPIILSTFSFSENYCSKNIMNNIEFATLNSDRKKINLKKYYIFQGHKQIHKQIAKSTYSYSEYNFYDEDYADRWIELTNSYLEEEEKHLGIPLDLSENGLYFDTLLNIGFFANYQKMDIKKTYLRLFKKQEFFSDFFQRPTLYKYMIMKNLDVATEKDLELYFDKIKNNLYSDNKSKENFFTKRAYFAFHTNENLDTVFSRIATIQKRSHYLELVLKHCNNRKNLLEKRKHPLKKNELINLFYSSFIYPEIQPIIEEYFYGVGLVSLWSQWNYKYYKARKDWIAAEHYMTIYYKKSDKGMKTLAYYDYIEALTYKSKDLVKIGNYFEAYETAISVIGNLSIQKEGIEDNFFPLVNQVKEIINDSSTSILDHFSKSGDYKTYERILKERNKYVLHILKRKY